MTGIGFFHGDPALLPPGLRRGAVAIGNFDGVHRGHMAVLGRTLEIARNAGIPALVLSFEPHPRTFFRPERPVFRLTPEAEKARLLALHGFHALAIKTFDAGFAAMDAEAFVGTILAGELGASHVVTGYDFHFGNRRQGTPEFLREAAGRHGFSVSQVAPFADEAGETVSSSRIRTALEGGDVRSANALLGRHYSVTGTVKPGARIGRTLGFPTANIALPEDNGLRHGIYAVRLVRADGSRHDGVASHGRRPTFDNGAPLLETFVFDFSGDLYGEEIRIEFADWIRPEERFESVEALVARMEVDKAEALVALARDRAAGG